MADVTAEDILKALRSQEQAMEAAATPAARAADFSKPEDLGAVWEAHRASLLAEPCSPQEAVRLDARRGKLADWVNAHLGPRAGLEPGRTLLIGGAAGAGKTSLGALVAVDALAAGCPVLCWQLELGRGEMLEHLVAQYLPPDAEFLSHAGGPTSARNTWWRTPFNGNEGTARAQRPLPDAWKGLLHIPELATDDAAASGETIIASMTGLADDCRKRRTVGTLKHACNGLVLVDYLQLLTMASRAAKDAGHEVLTTVCSRMAKTANTQGMVLVLLSQLTKESQKAGGTGLTGFSGADLARMAHVALMLNRADGNGEAVQENPYFATEHGERRVITVPKTRGTHGKRQPSSFGAWVMHRALHNADNAGLTTTSGNGASGLNKGTSGKKDAAPTFTPDVGD